MGSKKYYYKVVTEDLKSAIVNKNEKECIQYKINKWVKTNDINFGLFIFNKYEDDFSFKEVFSVIRNLKIYKVVCKNRIKEIRMRSLLAPSGFFAKCIEESRIVDIEMLHKTSLFEQVKLLEEIASF